MHEKDIKVICDETNNTPEDAANNVIRVEYSLLVNYIDITFTVGKDGLIDEHQN